ncbi:hypothetical protein RFI_10099, partial [Reticulomyxa filosa]
MQVQDVKSQYQRKKDILQIERKCETTQQLQLLAPPPQFLKIIIRHVKETVSSFENDVNPSAKNEKHEENVGDNVEKVPKEKSDATKKEEAAADKDVLNYVLPGVFVRLGEQSSDAFESEDSYLAYLEALFFLRFLIYDCKQLHSTFDQLEQLYVELYRKTDKKLTAYQTK